MQSEIQVLSWCSHIRLLPLDHFAHRCALCHVPVHRLNSHRSCNHTLFRTEACKIFYSVWGSRANKKKTIPCPKAHSLRGQIRVSPDALGSITSRCLGKEPAFLPRVLLGEGRPDTRERQKSSLQMHHLINVIYIYITLYNI